MTDIRLLARSVHQAMASCLLARGWQAFRRRKHTFLKTPAPDTHLRLEFRDWRCTAKSFSLEVGWAVYHEAVAQVVASVQGRLYEPCGFCLMGSAISNLLPRDSDWFYDFALGCAPDDTIARLISDLDTHVIPVLEQLSSIDNYLARLREAPFNQSDALQICAEAVTRGDTEGLVARIEECRRRLRDHSRLDEFEYYAEQLQKYAGAVLGDMATRDEGHTQ